MAARARPPGRTPQINLIVDSGAFSAWKLGKPVKIDDYIAFIQRNADWCRDYVVLDEINPNSPEKSASKSYENWLYMRSKGLEPIPVFHVHERMDWLFRMLDAGAKYIGLSASSLVQKNEINDWYALAWGHLVDSDGRPIVKVHAFGEGRERPMAMFPWQSTDSTSWIYTAQRTGSIRLPTGGTIGHRHDRKHVKTMPDYDMIDGLDRDHLMALLAAYGINPVVLEKRDRDADAVRCYLTFLYYSEIEKRIRQNGPTLYPPQGFFAPTPRAPGISIDPFNFYPVLGSNPCAWSVMAHARNPTGLVSYFYINSMSHYKGLRDFVYDPIGFCSTNPIHKKYFDVFQEFIHAR